MLSRIRIRSAIVAALAAGPPYSTIAGPMIFDSRIDNIWEQTPEGDMPLVLVYTDDDNSDLLDVASGRGARTRTLTVCIEMAVGSFSSKEQAEFNLITTDPELEAMLDILEWQIWNTLNDPLSPHFAALSRVNMGWVAWHSEAARSADKSVRLASRRVRAVMKVKPECVLPVGFTDAVQPDAIDPATSLFDAPHLKDLSDIVLSNPAMENVVTMLRYQQGGPLPESRRLTPGFSIVYRVDAIDPADPNRLPPGQTKGPDGRVEVIFSQKL